MAIAHFLDTGGTLARNMGHFDPIWRAPDLTRPCPPARDRRKFSPNGCEVRCYGATTPQEKRCLSDTVGETFTLKLLTAPSIVVTWTTAFGVV